jgi:ABC-type dipeptide/oligopeptide/nickel transport system ATPase subunit
MALLTVRGLEKSFRHGRFGPRVEALAGVDLGVAEGSKYALMGESGSGKTTLAKCIAGWETADSGEMILNSGTQPQLIPQNPGESLNPYWPAIDIIAEPYRLRKRGNEQKALSWMKMVGLKANAAQRKASQFSGGERARLAIARALAACDCDDGKPALLIFDESFSGFDLVVRAQLLDLLLNLQSRFALTFLLITHDFWLATRFADEIAVIDRGRIVECGAREQILFAPQSEAMQRFRAASLAFSAQ